MQKEGEYPHELGVQESMAGAWMVPLIILIFPIGLTYFLFKEWKRGRQKYLGTVKVRPGYGVANWIKKKKQLRTR